jgi:hypothetical protein
MADVERRLIAEFSASLPAEEVQRCIVDVVARFDGAPVRIYMTVLVERIARERLRIAAVDSARRPRRRRADQTRSQPTRFPVEVPAR